MIRTVIADDSAIVRAMLGQVIGDDSHFEIVGMAENGKAAVDMCSAIKPELVIMDINMPVLNGIEATSRIMENVFPQPAIVAFTTEDTAEIGYKCLDAGAVEIVQKPNLATMDRQKIENFCKELIVIADSYKKHKLNSEDLKKKHYAQSLANEIITEKMQNQKREDPYCFYLLAVGASTGGPIAIQKLLKDLGTSFPLPVIITQHIDEVFDNQLAFWLTNTTGFEVTTAHDGEILKAGHVYIAPSKKHLTIREKKHKEFGIVLDDSEEVHFLKPAVDKMFSSCAKVTGSKTLAVLLTGMGQDGAAGMKEIYDAGGYTIAQSESSSVVFGMPKAAIDLNCVKRVEDLDVMGKIIKQISGVSLD